MTKCLYCGGEITTKSHHKNGPEKKYCSLDCYRAARGRVTYGKSTCLYCGKEFEESRDRPNKFCSRMCSAKYYGELRTKRKNERLSLEKEEKQFRRQEKRKQKELERIQYEQSLIKPCEVCGNLFKAKSKTGKYCSVICANRHENRLKDKRIYRNGKPDHSISLEKLYKRDNGICQICGKHLEFVDDWNSWEYPSIDHIIPIAKGGKHEWNNVQLTCRKCNMEKRDKVG